MTEINKQVEINSKRTRRVKIDRGTYPYPLYIGGIVLLLTFLNVLINTALPLRFLQPEWQLQMSGVLLSVGTTALIAVLFLHLAEGEIHQRESVIGSRARLIRRLAGWAAIGYLLLIPGQVVAGFRLVNQRAAAEQQPKVLWGKLRARILATESEQELRKLLERIPEIPPLPNRLEGSLPKLKQDLVSSVDARFAARNTELESTARQRMQNFLTESIRNSIQSLLLAIGFAALAKQGRRHALSGLLDRLFPFL